jgi:hypothetical protein
MKAGKIEKIIRNFSNGRVSLRVCFEGEVDEREHRKVRDEIERKGAIFCFIDRLNIEAYIEDVGYDVVKELEGLGWKF